MTDPANNHPVTWVPAYHGNKFRAEGVCYVVGCPGHILGSFEVIPSRRPWKLDTIRHRVYDTLEECQTACDEANQQENYGSLLNRR